MASQGRTISNIIGFGIQPAQSLSDVKNIEKLHDDIISLMFSLTYHPEHITKVTLDLRYVASEDSSLVAKGLDIILLVRIDFEEYVTSSQAEELKEKFKSGK